LSHVFLDDGTREIWIPRRAPNLNDLFRARGIAYGKGKKRTDAYAALKKSWAETVVLAARPLHIMSLRTCRCRVHFEIVEPNERRDPDNFCSAAAKAILDGLVKSGVLAGDSWAHIAGLSFSWRVGKPAGVRVVLTPVEVAEKAGGRKPNLDPDETAKWMAGIRGGRHG
jgi:hypothetical protein